MVSVPNTRMMRSEISVDDFGVRLGIRISIDRSENLQNAADLFGCLHWAGYRLGHLATG